MRKNIRIKSLYKILFTVLAVLLVAIAVTAVTFTVYFEDTFNAFYNEQYSLIHDRIAENVIATEYRFWQQGSVIIDDIDISFYINGVETDDDARYRAVKAVKDNTGILGTSSISIFSAKDGVIWVGENMNKVSLDRFLAENNEFSENYKSYCEGENFFFSEDKRYVTFFYDDYRQFTVVFEIDREELKQKIIYAGNTENNDTWVYYKNEEPIISDGSNILQTVPGLSEKMDNSGGRGFVYKNMMYICNNVRNVLCISRVSYGKLISSALDDAPFIWILVVMLLVIIGVATYFVVKYIRQLMTNYVWQIAKFSKNAEMGKNELSAIRLFINREQNDDDINAIRNVFKDNPKPYYVALMLIIDEPEKLPGEMESIGKVSYKTKINKIVSNILSADGKCISVSISDEKIGVLCNTGAPEKIRKYTEKISEETEKEYGTTVTVIKSRITTDISDVGGCINSLRTVAEYRFIAGVNSFIDEETVNVHDADCEYPIDIQTEMIKSCNEKNFEKVEQLLDGFIKYIAENDYTVAENWTLMLFMNIIRNIRISDKALNFNTIGMLVKNNTFEEAAKRFMDYLKTDDEEIPAEFAVNQNFLSRVEEITEKNYANTDYDLNALAHMMNYSTVHLSRKFKKMSGQNFSQYLTEYRMEKAVNLLENTDMRVGEIAEQCGFGSRGYFSTTFKKYTSLTPQEYREKGKPGGNI